MHIRFELIAGVCSLDDRAHMHMHPGFTAGVCVCARERRSGLTAPKVQF